MAKVTCRTPGNPQPDECDWTRVEVARSIGNDSGATDWQNCVGQPSLGDTMVIRE